MFEGRVLEFFPLCRALMSQSGLWGEFGLERHRFGAGQARKIFGGKRSYGRDYCLLRQGENEKADAGRKGDHTEQRQTRASGRVCLVRDQNDQVHLCQAGCEGKRYDRGAASLTCPIRYIPVHIRIGQLHPYRFMKRPPRSVRRVFD